MDSGNQFITNLLHAGAKQKIPIIAEIKAYTPKEGELLRHRAVEDVAECYQDSGMACLSVVTGRWFGGSLNLLERVASAASLPILRKDFIVSRSSIERSKQLGASAILLTKRLVDDKQFKRLSEYALSLGLTPFIEVSELRELDGLKLVPEEVLAVCNRDIRTQETDDGDISNSLQLLSAARETGAGAIVSASAIGRPEEARQLLASGYDALLIGTCFLKAPDLQLILDEFHLSTLRNDYGKYQHRRNRAQNHASKNLRNNGPRGTSNAG